MAIAQTTPRTAAETAAVTEPEGPSEPAREPARSPDEELVEDDLLIEDVSIDGMCGVY